MKTLSSIILTFIIILPAVIGCRKEAHGVETAMLSLHAVTGTDPFSRAPDAMVDTAAKPYESRIRSVDYYIFRPDGSLETSLHSDNGEWREVAVSIGRKLIWAVVNMDTLRFSGCRDMESFESVIVCLEDHVGFYFPMAGSVEAVIMEGENEAELEVSRFVSRITLAGVNNALSGPLAGEEITVETVYLSNVRVSCSLGGGTGTGEWTNRFGIMEEDENMGITSSLENAVCPWGQNTTIGTALYGCPNPCSVDVTGRSDTFSPRFTRLVVEGRIKGRLYYYPVSVPSMGRNKAYSVFLTITRPGSEDPDLPVWGYAISAGVGISDNEHDGGCVDVIF